MVEISYIKGIACAFQVKVPGSFENGTVQLMGGI